jgi:hypothetical protein
MNYILTDHALTVFTDTGAKTLHADDSRWLAAMDYLRAEDEIALIDLLTPSVIVSRAFAQVNDLTLEDDVIYHKGEPVDNYLTTKIVQFARNDLPFQPLLEFLHRVLQNPSRRAVEELYRFLEHGSLPITPDGCFLAYKRVRDDYKDVHSGKMDNSVGKVVSMPRNQVDDNPNNTCSHGLHFCSREYLRSFSGERIMVLKIDPANVVSIPVDYNNTKGRCCQYEVVGEIPLEDADQHTFSSHYEDGFDELDEDEYDEGDEYSYDSDGFNEAGYNWHGYDRDGYHRDGYNREGYNREGKRRYE